MALFKKNKFAWSEPWFFCQRVRDRWDWLKAIVPAVLAWAGVSFLVHQAQAPNMPWWQIVLWGLAAGAVVQLGIEAAFLRRDAWIDEDAIEVFGNAGQITSHVKYPLRQITFLELRRSEEIGLPFAMLVLRLENSGGIIGIPASIRLERLALVLHQLNVPVTLSGWEPPADTTSDSNEYVYFAPEGAALQVARAEAVPEPDQNLNPMPHMIFALLIAGWLMLVWLGLVIWGGIYLYQNWNQISIYVSLCCMIAMFCSMTIPFTYIEMFGDYWSAHYLIAVAKKKAQLRSASLIKSFEETLFCVEAIQRETWDKLPPKVIDFGFLRIDSNRELILFEGNKERWTIPFSSVQQCKIEEVQYGTGGEGVNSELRCFVALTYQKDSGPFEIGLRNADKEIGKNSDSRRMRKAVELFEYLTKGL